MDIDKGLFPADYNVACYCSYRIYMEVASRRMYFVSLEQLWYSVLLVVPYLHLPVPVTVLCIETTFYPADINPS